MPVLIVGRTRGSIDEDEDEEPGVELVVVTGLLLELVVVLELEPEVVMLGEVVVESPSTSVVPLTAVVAGFVTTCVVT